MIESWNVLKLCGQRVQLLSESFFLSFHSFFLCSSILLTFAITLTLSELIHFASFTPLSCRFSQISNKLQTILMSCLVCCRAPQKSYVWKDINHITFDYTKKRRNKKTIHLSVVIPHWKYTMICFCITEMVDIMVSKCRHGIIFSNVWYSTEISTDTHSFVFVRQLPKCNGSDDLDWIITYNKQIATTNITFM